MNQRVTRIGRVLIVVVGIVIAAVIGWGLFIELPDSAAELLGVVFAIAVVIVGARIASRIASNLLPAYNVAAVSVEGPITRDGRNRLPTAPGGTPADDIVDEIERADDDRHADALLVELNTPGGEVVPSDDIRRAAESFEGPTVAYATDICASGGYWIASGCDELWARDASIVGSIGVLGSKVNAVELADKLGVSYERFAAGKYKDAGVPLKELEGDDREYLQGIVDDFYDRFIDRVTDGRDIDATTVRETEARVYLGEDALELELVDELGTRDDIEEVLEERLGEPIQVREFEPERGLTERFRFGAQELVYAFGAGIAGFAGGDGVQFELR